MIDGRIKIDNCILQRSMSEPMDLAAPVDVYADRRGDERMIVIQSGNVAISIRADELRAAVFFLTNYASMIRLPR